MFAMQCRTYEAFAPFGNTFAALCAGFAVMIAGTLYITPDGERYAGID